jgi:hypothetical protein
MIRKFTLILSLFVAVISNIQAQNNNYKIQSAPNSGVFVESTKPVSDPSNGIDTIRISSSNRSIAKYVVASQHERVAFTVQQSEPTYQYISKPKRYINDFALGLYYSQESFLDPISWDSLRFRNSDAQFVPGSQMNKVSGFGFHFLFGGRQFVPQTQIGSFNWGLGMDFNHFRRGPKSDVVFNTDLEDKGFTRLETSAFNFHGIARFEKRVGLIYPYAAAKIGFNLYSTQQYTEAYRNSTSYESQNTENISTDVTPFFSYELGVRARLTGGFSVFASYENRTGNKLEVVNLSQSTFNGFTYNNDVRVLDYKIENIKFGVLFNLSAAERERREITPERFDTTYMTNLVVFDTVWLDEPIYREEILKVTDSRLKGYYLTKCKNCFCDTTKKTSIINSRLNGGNGNGRPNNNSELKPAPSKSSAPKNSNSDINSGSNSSGTIQTFPNNPNPSPTPTGSGSGTIKAFPGIKPPPTTIKKPKA